MCHIHIRQRRMQPNMEINFWHSKCWTKQHPMGVTNLIILMRLKGLLHGIHQAMAPANPWVPRTSPSGLQGGGAVLNYDP